jgi:hypothetical protein
VSRLTHAEVLNLSDQRKASSNFEKTPEVSQIGQKAFKETSKSFQEFDVPLISYELILEALEHLESEGNFQEQDTPSP